jgi:hypothetical protein
MAGWFEARLAAVIDGLIGIVVAALVGFIYASGVSGFVALALLVVGGAAVVVTHRVRRRRATERADGAIPDDFWLALIKLRTPHPLLLDDPHHYTRVTQAFRIHGQDGTFELTYEGVNVSDRPSSCFREAVAGDSPIDLRDMNLSARDLTDGSTLTWSAVVDEPYRKVVDVRFRQPVLPGERFKVAVSCTWRSTFTRPRDYVFFLAEHRRRGVDTRRMELTLCRPPAFYEGLAGGPRGSVTAASQPTATVHQDGSCTLVWDITGIPARSVPVIQFERTDHGEAPGAPRILLPDTGHR